MMILLVFHQKIECEKFFKQKSEKFLLEKLILTKNLQAKLKNLKISDDFRRILFLNMNFYQKNSEIISKNESKKIFPSKNRALSLVK